MDYKLGALHKVYKRKEAIIGALFNICGIVIILGFVGLLTTAILSIFQVSFTVLFGTISTILIGCGMLALLIVSMIGDILTNASVERAESEYQYELARIKREKESAIEEQFRKIMDKNKERNDKIDSVVHFILDGRPFEVLDEKITKLEKAHSVLTAQVKHMDEQKPSALDKKLEPKKPCPPIIPTKDHKITLQEFFAMNKACIHVKNEKQAVKLCEAFDNMGKKWCNGEESYLLTTNYGNHKNETCYTNRGTYANKEWFVHDGGWVIYDFSEVCFEPKKKGGK